MAQNALKRIGNVAMNTVAISFLIYTLAIAVLGVVSSRFAKQTHADFLLADRGLGAWVAGLSSAASSESGWVTLGLVGFAYQTGVGAFWVVPMTFFAMVFNWFVMGPRLRQASVDQDSLTVVDVIASRYSARYAFWIRIIGIAIVLSMLTAYVAAQLNAAGKTFTGTFGWNYGTGVLVGATIILVYTIVGGFRAISWTDVAQSIFMILAVTVIPLLLIYHLGGFRDFWQKLGALENGDQLTDIYAGKSGFALFGFLALWLGIPLANPGQPHSLVRLMSARDDQAIFRGGIICTIWVTTLFAGAILLGIAARVYYGDITDPENTLPVIAKDADLIPGVIGGMLLAAILAAICSTADSQLLVSASAVSHDLLERIFGVTPTLKSRKTIERCSLVFVAIIATAIAIGEVRSVFTFVLDYGWAGLGAGIGPALIMSLLWKRTTGLGVIAGMLVGITTVVVWQQFPRLADSCYNLVPAFFGSLASIVIVSHLSGSKTNLND
jgi:SSS family solute:Na+ symporter